MVEPISPAVVLERMQALHIVTIGALDQSDHTAVRGAQKVLDSLLCRARIANHLLIQPVLVGRRFHDVSG